MRRTLTDQAGLSPWAVVAILAVLAVGFFVMLGIGGVAWYVLARRPAPPPPALQPGQEPAPQPARPATPARPGPQPSFPAGQPWPSSPSGPSPAGGQPAGPPPQVSYSWYLDPGGEFCVQYPSGWRVLPGESGVSFTPPGEDSSDGSSASFSRMLATYGRVVPAQQDLDGLVGRMRRQYPDLRVETLQIRPMPQDSESAFLEASWTNGRGEPMHGVLLGTYLHSRVANFSMKHFKAFQAQRVAWPSLVPVFQHMARSHAFLPQKPTEGRPREEALCR
ncbi:MAG: hypothetical protein QN151_07860 [Armatimonadota bacterium]|nr:hypothetical protein [Armatimonadota bacterium]MDR7564732.1 hypothetical protein [Armatimonadota bacterium]MDR7578246.1 hypothetical protein [Armatimonadota bacterium]MDR7590661.1 hypothetical protein [Armatimonadota bacterium]